ncbi:MAG: alpha/beta fold hydrolase [Pseudomonadota bacterium]|nr:alpha/beta fold hydrolase [Pseudomonadota bacterium]
MATEIHKEPRHKIGGAILLLAALVMAGVLSLPGAAAGEKPTTEPATPRLPPLVMIHGMFVGPWCWDNYRDYFERRGYRVITPTLRGHDTPLREPPPPELRQVGIGDYVADVEKELREIDEKPVIIGHSMGGLIAQLLAAKGLARAVILIVPAVPRGISPISWTGIKSAWMNRQRLGHWGEPLRPTLAGAAYSSLHLLPPEDREKVFARFTYESPRAAWEISFWPFDRRKATAVEATRVTCPVLTIAGGQDRLVPPAIVRKIHAKYQAVSEYREFPRHSHFLIAEPGWEAPAREIEFWLGKNVKP